MSPMLASLLGNGALHLGRCVPQTRHIGTRPKFCEESSYSLHPEYRRNTPFIYMNRDRRRSEASPSRDYRYQVHSAQYRWAEFRRHMIFGTY